MEKKRKRKIENFYLDYLDVLTDEQLFKELGYNLVEELDLQDVSPIVDMVGSWDRQTLIYALTIGDGYINSRVY